MSTQEFLLARVEALQNKVIELEAEVKLENENKRRIVTDLQMDIDELVNVIKGLDPTNPILQHLTL
jgi:hypothetical protein